MSNFIIKQLIGYCIRRNPFLLNFYQSPVNRGNPHASILIFQHTSYSCIVIQRVFQFKCCRINRISCSIECCNYKVFSGLTKNTHIKRQCFFQNQPDVSIIINNVFFYHIPCAYVQGIVKIFTEKIFFIKRKGFGKYFSVKYPD